MLEENDIELDEISREGKKTRNNSCYTALVTKLAKLEPTSAEEALTSQAWKVAKIEEYQSILQNDV